MTNNTAASFSPPGSMRAAMPPLRSTMKAPGPGATSAKRANTGASFAAARTDFGIVGARPPPSPTTSTSGAPRAVRATSPVGQRGHPRQRSAPAVGGQVNLAAQAAAGAAQRLPVIMQTEDANSER